MICRDLSIHLDLDHVWWWSAPQPLQPATTPTVTFAHADGANFSPVLAPIASPGTVTAISGDRSRLTLSAPLASVAGVPGEYGEAWILTDDGGAYPVRVRAITDTTAE